MDGREIELKLGLAPEDMERLRRRCCFDDHRQGQPTTRRLVSIYFDTPDFALAAAGVSVRVRAVDEGHVQTVKTIGSGSSGLFSRDEWETPLDSPDLAAAPLLATGLALFTDAGLIERLAPVFSTRIDRTTYRLSGGSGAAGDAWEVEAALDQGEVVAGSHSETICEVELELRGGSPDRLFALARRVLEAVPARPLVFTKSERGYRLAAGLHRPFKGKAPPLSFDLTVAEAFQTIARSCLDHLLINEHCLLATGDGEAVHQMRVALRRLRSALKVFRPIVDGPQLTEVKSDLRWVLASLGPARDSEVFLTEIIDPVIALHPDNAGLEALRDYWRDDHRTKMTLAVEAVRSPRFAALALRLGEWVETGDWLPRPGKSPRRKLDDPIASFAMPRLAKAVGKLLALAGPAIGRLSPEDQHLVRIQCKQVRYAGEFFTTLVPRKQMKVFLAELAELQDVLGRLNDIAVATPKLTGKHVEGGRAKAAGLVAGWHQSRRAALISEAEKAWKRWRDCPQPWVDG